MLIKKKKIPFAAIITIGLLPSFLKKAIYRAKGYKIGKGVRIGPGTVIIGKKVIVADNAKFGLMTVIRAKNIDIGRFASVGSFSMIDTGELAMGDDAKINEQVIVGGMQTPDSALTMGKRTVIMEYSFINTTRPVSIGDDSGVGGHCLLFTHGSWLNQMEGFPVTFAPITIGKNVWLPWRVFIMPGVTIGDRVVVGANSLLTKSVPGNCLVAGSPAKIIRENYISEPGSEQKLAMFTGYLDAFKEWLNHNGLHAVMSNNAEGFALEVREPRKTHRLICGEAVNISEQADLLVVNINAGHGYRFEKPPGVRMMLDISKKERTGTSELGEEFVKFLSRYGLRFDRMDT